MSLSLLAAFVAACVLLAVTPGPNMSLIIANTIGHGLKAGFVTLAGAATGLATLVTIAAVGMTSVMVLMSEWFDVIRWAGAVYLIWLGARQLWAWWSSRGGPAPVRSGSGLGWYTQGLLVSLSNPKVLLFLGAFLPQFVDPAAAPGPQLAVLAVIFVATLVTVDAGYTLAVARARRLRSAPASLPRRRGGRAADARRAGAGDRAPPVIAVEQSPAPPDRTPP